MEAEYYAADECVKEVIWFRALLEELGHTQHAPTILHEDNDACIYHFLKITHVMHAQSTLTCAHIVCVIMYLIIYAL